MSDLGGELETAARYRDRSEELKRLAQATPNHRIRRALLYIAKDYDKMVELIEAAEAEATARELRALHAKDGSPGSSCP